MSTSETDRSAGGRIDNSGLGGIAEAHRLAQAGDLTGAERLLRAATGSDDPAAAAMAAGELGNLLQRQGMEDEAVSWWELAVLSDYSVPGSLSAYNLGVVYEARGEIEEARDAFSMAVLMGRQLAPELEGLGQENPADDAETRLVALEARRARDPRGRSEI